MITRLALKNWRSHEDSEFEFSKGTNVLVGPMGSGKSTAMDAISFALFGTFPNLNSKKLKLDDIIMNKPAIKNKASVEVNVKLGGKEYRIKRTIERGRGVTTSEVWYNDRLIEGPQTKRASEKIQELLKMNYELFSRAVYAEQNNIDYFLEIPKGKRKDRIDELLMINKFENSRKNLTTVTNRLKDMCEDKKRFVSEIREIDQVPLLEKEIRERKNLKDLKESEMLSYSREKEKIEKLYKEMSEKKKEFNDIMDTIKQGTGSLELFDKKVRSYGKVEKTKEGAKEELGLLVLVRAEISKKTQEKERLVTEIERRKAQIEAAEKNLEDYSRKLREIKITPDIAEKEKKLKGELGEKSHKIEERKGHQKFLSMHLSHLDDSIMRLEEGVEVCPVCDSEISGNRRVGLIEKKSTERIDRKEELEALDSEIKELVVGKGELEEKLKEIAEILRKADEHKWLTESLEKAKTEIGENKEMVSELVFKNESIKIEKSAEEIDLEMKELNRIGEYYSLLDEHEDMKKMIAELHNELKDLDYNENLEKEAYEKLKETEKSLALVEQEKRNLDDLILEKEKRLTELTKIKEEVRQTKEEIDYLYSTVDSFEILQNVLQNVQMSLRQNFTEETNLALSEVWRRLYPYGDYADLKLDVDDSGDYVLQLRDRRGNWINVEGITSGGERSTACLALRIAFSLVLAGNLSWLVLDEPTHNLDKKAIAGLAVTLRDHLPQIVDQIFIITHEPELEKAASGYLYRLERNKEEDEPTKISAETVSAFI